MIDENSNQFHFKVFKLISLQFNKMVLPTHNVKARDPVGSKNCTLYMYILLFVAQLIQAVNNFKALSKCQTLWSYDFKCPLKYSHPAHDIMRISITRTFLARRNLEWVEKEIHKTNLDLSTNYCCIVLSFLFVLTVNG